MAANDTTDQLLSALAALIFAGIIDFLYLYHYIHYVVIVNNQTEVVVERCGIFHKVLTPGCHCLVPFADRKVPFDQVDMHIMYDRGQVQEYVVARTGEQRYVVDKRLQILDMEIQPVITRDNVQLHVHPMAFYRIANSQLAVYEVQNLYQAMQILITTTMRAIIGQLTLDDTLCSRNEIKKQVFDRISLTVANWGAELVDVDILEVEPPNEILDVMEKQLKAERNRRRSLVKADANRQIKKMHSEQSAQQTVEVTIGNAQKDTMIASAQGEAKRIQVQAYCDSLQQIGQFIKAYDVGKYWLQLYWIEAIEDVVNSAKNITVVKDVHQLQEFFD